jgi:hypothetical protein
MQAGVMMCAYHPSYTGGVSRKITAQTDPSKNIRPIQQITEEERAGGMAQEGKHLPSKLKAQSSKPSTAKQKHGG